MYPYNENYNENIDTESTPPMVVKTVSDSTEHAMYEGFIKNLRKISEKPESSSFDECKLPKGVIYALADLLAQDTIRAISSVEVEPGTSSFRATSSLSVLITTFEKLSADKQALAEEFPFLHKMKARDEKLYKLLIDDVVTFKKMPKYARSVKKNHKTYRFAKYNIHDLNAIASEATAYLNQFIGDTAIPVKINVDMYATVNQYPQTEDAANDAANLSTMIRIAFEVLVG